MYMRCLPVRHLGHDFAAAFYIAREISPALPDEDLLRVQDIVRGIALYRGVGAVGPGVQAARWTAQRYRVHALFLQWLELKPIELLAILFPEPGEVDALSLAARGLARFAGRRERERFPFGGLWMRREESRNTRAACAAAPLHSRKDPRKVDGIDVGPAHHLHGIGIGLAFVVARVLGLKQHRGRSRGK